MADFCYQCNLDHCFGAYSDFDHLVELYPKATLFQVMCEGCGTVYVDREGKCVDTLCVLHNTKRSREVLRWATEWAARRTGPYRLFYRLWDRWDGTPWDPGYKHFLRWRWFDFLNRVRGKDDDLPL